MKIALTIAAIVLPTTSLVAQVRSGRDTTTAYGARLTAQAQASGINARRVNNRIDSRLNNRLGLRIERYEIGRVGDPAAAFRAAPDDKSRTPAPRDQTLPSPPTED